MDYYYFVENGRQNGPFSLEDLKTKSLHRESLIWKDGMADWQPAQNIPELKDILFSTPPPVPNPTPPPIPNLREKTVKPNQPGKNVRMILIAILGFFIFLDLIVLFQDLSHNAYGEAFALFIGLVVLLIILYFLARNRKYHSTSQTNRVEEGSQENTGWTPPRPGVSDIDVREIFETRKGRVEVSGIVDGGGNLSIQDKMGKIWLIDFRPAGDGKWMPVILAGDEISIIGTWQNKKYVLVNYVYNNSSHTKGKNRNSKFPIFLFVVLVIIVIIILLVKSSKGG
jgi:Ca2+/Na+ antiporter